MEGEETKYQSGNNNKSKGDRKVANVRGKNDQKKKVKNREGKKKTGKEKGGVYIQDKEREKKKDLNKR